MKINWLEDIGAPAAVTVANLAIRSTKPEWEEYASYIITAAGYIGYFMNWGGPFVKNLGIAEFPIAAEKLYDRIKGGVGRASLTTRRVSRYPAPSSQSPFSSARLV